MNKDIAIIGLSLALICVICIFYYHDKVQKKAQQQNLMAERQFLISVHYLMYHAAESGDEEQGVKKIKSTLATVLWDEVRDYQQHYGEVMGTNDFANRFASAMRIADRVQMVPVIIKPNGEINLNGADAK